MPNKYDCVTTLQTLGITAQDAVNLRRISMTLQRWHELECGTGDGQTTYLIERDGDEPDSKPYKRVLYPTLMGYVDKRYPIPDKETGARKRLAAIMARYPHYRAYVQGDPRGCALYILRPDDAPIGQEDLHYSRGIAVYK